MTKIILDLETNGLLLELTKIHCVSLRQVSTNKEHLYIGADLQQNFINELRSTEDVEFIGHNIYQFDNEVLKKLYDIDLTKDFKITDTIIMSQLLFPDIKGRDFEEMKVPGKLIGSHSLKAWGYRLDCHKGEYTGGFEEYNTEMGVYCSQDTEVTRVLYNYLLEQLGERTWK